jgi:hypothetical protein
VGVALLEASGVGQEAYALGGRERVVELAVRADIEAGLEFLLVDRLLTPLTLGEDAVYLAEAALCLRLRIGAGPRVLPPLV